MSIYFNSPWWIYKRLKKTFPKLHRSKRTVFKIVDMKRYFTHCTFSKFNSILITTTCHNEIWDISSWYNKISTSSLCLLVSYKHFQIIKQRYTSQITTCIVYIIFFRNISVLIIISKIIISVILMKIKILMKALVNWIQLLIWQVYLCKMISNGQSAVNEQISPPQWNPPWRGEGAYLTKRFHPSASKSRACRSDAATFDKD